MNDSNFSPLLGVITLVFWAFLLNYSSLKSAQKVIAANTRLHNVEIYQEDCWLWSHIYLKADVAQIAPKVAKPANVGSGRFGNIFGLVLPERGCWYVGTTFYGHLFNWKSPAFWEPARRAEGYRQYSDYAWIK